MEVVINWEKLACPVTSPSLGLLVGMSMPASGKTITGQCNCQTSTLPPLPALNALGLSTPDWVATRQLLSQYFPVGCVEVGVLVKLQGEKMTQETVQGLMKTLWSDTNLSTVFGVGDVVVVVVTHSKQSDGSIWKFDTGSCNLELYGNVTETANVDSHIRNETVVFRIRASIPLFIPAIGDVEDHLVDLQLDTVVFYLPSHSQLLLWSRPLTLANIVGSRRDVCQPSWSDPIPVEILKNVTVDGTGDTPTAPVINFESGNSGSGDMLQLELPLDIVCIFSVQTPLAEVVSKMKDGVRAQVRAIAEVMGEKKCQPRSVSVCHYPIPTSHTPVTVVRLCEGEEEAVHWRRQWHLVFGLPNTRPFLRTSNRQFFAKLQVPCLVNPHTAVRQTRVTDGTQALVQGSYTYHHYMQDSFNDDGWGCAYRSLQTLWSWFLLQGYTQLPVPSHLQVQQALVDVGDKQKSLLGSKEWIGSFEVATCLNHLLGVESRIHHCSSGAAMASVGRVLLQHFQDQGTPVMIGGGVLAHTILGVDFSKSTGEIRFLVLDPHYTGKDELKTVIDKGWCGWKPVTFWDQQAHYNLCMPQPPVEI